MKKVNERRGLLSENGKWRVTAEYMRYERPLYHWYAVISDLAAGTAGSGR